MDDEDVDYLLTRISRRIERGFRTMVRELQDQNSLGAIESRIARGQVDELLAGISDAAENLAIDINTGYVQAGQRVARWLDGEVDSRVTFSVHDDAAVDWMTDQADTFVAAMVKEQQEVAAEIVRRGRARGWSNKDIAEDVRASIGLNQQQVGYIDSYRDAIESNDFRNAMNRELADGRYDRSLRAAGEAETAINADRVDAMVDAYRDNWVDKRGEFISEQEGSSAMEAGMDEALDQAVARGDVDANDVTRTWITCDDSKVRISHKPMHGQQRGIGETFRSGYGNELRYPCDENVSFDDTAGCRCRLILDVAA